MKQNQFRSKASSSSAKNLIECDNKNFKSPYKSKEQTTTQTPGDSLEYTYGKNMKPR